MNKGTVFKEGSNMRIGVCGKMNDNDSPVDEGTTAVFDRYSAFHSPTCESSMATSSSGRVARWSLEGKTAVVTGGTKVGGHTPENERASVDYVLVCWERRMCEVCYF